MNILWSVQEMVMEGKVPNHSDVRVSGSFVKSDVNNATLRAPILDKSKTCKKIYTNTKTDSDGYLPVTEIKLKSYGSFVHYITKYEVPRKLFHSSVGFVTLYLYTQGFDYNKIKILLVLVFIIIGFLDLVRLRVPVFNKLYCRCLGILMRKKEVYIYNGVLWYLLGLILSFNFFSKDIAIVSLLLLSWCDTAASVFGRKYGHLTPKLARNKSLAGSIAAFTLGIFIYAMFYGYFVSFYPDVNKPGELLWSPSTSKASLLHMSIIGGFIAAISEGVNLFNWDDNLTIPFLSAILMRLVIAVFSTEPFL